MYFSCCIKDKQKLYNILNLGSYKRTLNNNPLARWPAQLSTAKNMQVQVIYRLWAVFSIIDNQAKSIHQAFLFRDFMGNIHQTTE